MMIKIKKKRSCLNASFSIFIFFLVPKCYKCYTFTFLGKKQATKNNLLTMSTLYSNCSFFSHLKKKKRFVETSNLNQNWRKLEVLIFFLCLLHKKYRGVWAFSIPNVPISPMMRYEYSENIFKFFLKSIWERFSNIFYFSFEIGF